MVAATPAANPPSSHGTGSGAGPMGRSSAATALITAAGVAVGVGLGYGLAAVINAVAAEDLPMGPAPLPVPWLLGGFAAGVAATMVASWLPTRRVVRVSPLAALRPAAAVDGRMATGRARTLLATSLLVAGLVLLGAAVFLRSAALMVAGGGSVFAGVLLFGPVLIPRLIRVTGTLLGPAGRLATKNAVRNPRRIGITLTTAALIGLATASTGVTEEVDTRHPVDAALTTQEKPFAADVLDRVRSTAGVERAVPVDGVVARVAGLDKPLPVVTAPDAARVARDGGAFARMAPGTIGLDRQILSPSSGLGVGDRVTVRVGDREAELKVVAGWGATGLVAPETLATLTDAAEPYAIWVRATADADPLALASALDELADPLGATVEASLQARSTRSSVETQLGVLTWSVLGLLGIAMAIALIGIANTLGLSVLERGREHAMLRALGLTRGQLRRLLAVEAVLLSVVATLVGTVLGVGFGWVGYEAVVKPALSGASMQFPWLPLGGVVLLSALAGLVAGVLPARRAARVTPAAGLSLD
jgi:putative ABC transport system permease protein